MLRYAARISLRGASHSRVLCLPVRMRHALHLQRFTPEQLASMHTAELSLQASRELNARTDTHADTDPDSYPTVVDQHPLFSQLLRNYDSNTLRSAVLSGGAGAGGPGADGADGAGGAMPMPMSEEMSTAVMTAVRRKGSLEDLRELRAILSSEGHSSLLTLNMTTIDALVERCVNLGDVNEAVQWFLLAQERLGLQPGLACYSNLLCAAARMRVWDLVLFLYDDMHFHGVPTNRTIRDELLKEAARQPLTRWRFVKTLLLDCMGTSTAAAHTNTNTTATGTGGTSTTGADTMGASTSTGAITGTGSSSQVQFPVSPLHLAAAFDTLVRAEQYAEARGLHRALRGAGPACHDSLLLPLGQAVSLGGGNVICLCRMLLLDVLCLMSYAVCCLLFAV
jgi:hypothetical protein